jgi:hemerythrin-like domain-containing protein
MNIIELLKQQHEEVKELLERMIAEDDKKEARSLLGQVAKAMRLHMIIEEKMVYTAANRAFQGDEDDEESVIEAYEEHALNRLCLENLEKTPPNDKRFVVRAKIVKELFERHVEEEENELLPELEGKLGRDGIEKLGDQVERRLPDFESQVASGERSTGASRGSTGASRGSSRSRPTPAASRGARSGASAKRPGRPAKTGAAVRPGASRGGSRTSKSTANTAAKPRRGQSSSRS